MNTNRDPRELAVDLLPRSTCSVQVAAVIADDHGIFSWGTNHVGFDGFGQHAEMEAMRRANRNRLAFSTVYVVSQRRRNKKMVYSKPCEGCMKKLNKWGITAEFRDSDGTWLSM